MSSVYFGGSFPGSNPFFVDGDHTIPSPCSIPIITYPFEGDSCQPLRPRARRTGASNLSGFKYELFDPLGEEANLCGEAFIIEQDFMVASDWFGPLALNTPYDQASFAPGYQGGMILGLAILVSEGGARDMGGGLVRFTRTYASVPPPRNSYETFTFTFPGAMGGGFSAQAIGITDENLDPNGETSGSRIVQLNGSNSLTTEIGCRVERIYFRVEPGDAFSPDFESPDSLFYIEPKFRVFFGAFVNEVPSVWESQWTDKVDFQSVDDSPIDPSTIPIGTIPPLITNSAGADVDSGVGYLNMLGQVEICVKASTIRPWRGNIYEKTTLWAVAE
jgi:hypothetical protein